MAGLNERQWFLIAVLLYGVSTLYGVFVWRRGFRRDNRVCFGLVLAGLAANVTAMFVRGVSLARCPVTNLFEATMFIGWAVALVAVVFGLIRRFQFVPVLASPVLFGLGVFGLMPGLDGAGPEPQFWRGFASLHASITLLAYGALGLGALAGVMFLVQGHDLKYRKLRAFSALLPPLQRLERITWWSVLVGFVLLSVGLLLGAGWLHHETGTFWSADPKIIWSAVVWVGYLVLLVLHARRRPGGRPLAWGVVGAFAFVMLTFWGTNLLSPIHHP